MVAAVCHKRDVSKNNEDDVLNQLGEAVNPNFTSSRPSATCVSTTSATTSAQCIVDLRQVLFQDVVQRLRPMYAERFPLLKTSPPAKELDRCTWFSPGNWSPRPPNMQVDTFNKIAPDYQNLF